MNVRHGPCEYGDEMRFEVFGNEWQVTARPDKREESGAGQEMYRLYILLYISCVPTCW